MERPESFEGWMEGVPREIKDDALWQMMLYRQALFLGEMVWFDVCKLVDDRRTMRLSDQLYRAIGSISANIAEGYSRASRKDQARFYEYGLGSARESRDWYYKGRHVLGKPVAGHRLGLLVHIIRQLLTLVPSTRGRKLAEEPTPYDAHPLDSLLTHIPYP